MLSPLRVLRRSGAAARPAARAFSESSNALVGRFYKRALPVDREEGWGVELDGRPLRSPQRALFVAPSESIAVAVGAEWEAQSGVIAPHLMPLTRLAFTAMDNSAEDRVRGAKELLAYVDTDTVCFRVEMGGRQDALAEAMVETWDPLLAWAAEAHGAALETTLGFGVSHPPEAIEALRAYVDGLGSYELACLDSAVTSAKSFVIGAALVAGRLAPKEALAASRLEERHQIADWGHVEGVDGHDGPEADLGSRMAAAALMSELLRMAEAE